MMGVPYRRRRTSRASIACYSTAVLARACRSCFFICISPRAALIVALGLVCVWPSVADVYIGPGAGFALLSSFFGLLATIVLGMLSLLRWPFRAVRWCSGGGLVGGGGWGRIGFGDSSLSGSMGRIRGLTDAALKAGKLPHFAKLAKAGCYHRLRTTCPPVSPVAWSSFATGTNPGRHGIFDFIDPRSAVVSAADLVRRASEVSIACLEARAVSDPAAAAGHSTAAEIEAVLDAARRRRIWSTVLRVPITFPPDQFFGAQLSAMAARICSGRKARSCSTPRGRRLAGSRRAASAFRSRSTGDRAETRITGPANSLRRGSRRLKSRCASHARAPA